MLKFSSQYFRVFEKLSITIRIIDRTISNPVNKYTFRKLMLSKTIARIVMKDNPNIHESKKFCIKLFLNTSFRGMIKFPKRKGKVTSVGTAKNVLTMSGIGRKWDRAPEINIWAIATRSTEKLTEFLPNCFSKIFIQNYPKNRHRTTLNYNCTAPRSLNRLFSIFVLVSMKLLQRAWNYFCWQCKYGLKARYCLLKGDYVFHVGGAEAKMRMSNIEEASGLLFTYITEKPIIENLVGEVKQGEVFWDVGANVGLYSCLVADQGAYVVAFEPIPTVVERLRENVELNHKINVSVLDVALSNFDGEAEMQSIFDLIDCQHSKLAVGNEGKHGNMIKVKAVMGDSLVKSGVPKPDLVKVDVEGAEQLVIDGMKKTLTDCRVIFCEVHRRKIGTFGGSSENLEETLRDLGFSLERFLDRKTDYHLKATK
jgi:FkbM family methyltransferase